MRPEDMNLRQLARLYQRCNPEMSRAQAIGQAVFAKETCVHCWGSGYLAHVVRGQLGLFAWARVNLPEALVPWCDCHYRAKAVIRFRQFREHIEIRAAISRREKLLKESGLSERFRKMEHAAILNLPNSQQAGKIGAIAACRMLSAECQVSLEGLQHYVKNSKLAELTDLTFYRSLVLTGKPGRGKTAALSVVFRELLYELEGGLMIQWDEYVRQVQDKYSDYTAESFLQEAIQTPVLFIDDLGDVDSDVSVTSNQRNLLWRIINHRHGQELITLISTNLGKDQLARQFGTKTVERIFEMALVLEMNGINLRGVL